MARRTILLSEVNLTEESVNLDISGNLAVTGTSTFTGVSSFGNGTAAAPSITFTSDPDTGFYRATSNIIGVASNGLGGIGFDPTYGISIAAAYEIGWSGSSDITAAHDTRLVRDAADILAMKNGTTAQTQRWYGTTTNSQYVQITHNGTNGIITTSGGTFGFGVQTTSAATNVNGITGYISIVDEGGTPRRLAVVT